VISKKAEMADKSGSLTRGHGSETW